MNEWRELVERRARETGADLPPSAVSELAAHLEDLYHAAREAGQDDAAACGAAMAALDESPLSQIVDRPHARFREPVALSPAPFAGPSPFRSTSMWQAVRLAFRQFTHHRSFAVITVLVLGLGIGASVAVYSVADAVLFRPLPYEAPDRLVMLWETNHEKGLAHEGLSPVNFMDYRALDAFAETAAWWRPEVNLVDPGLEPVRVKAVEASGNLFKTLGVRPQLGPGFPVDGPFFSGDLIAVISDRLWHSRYNADSAIVGKRLTFNGTPYTIAGVMPPRFDFPGDVDVWERLRWNLTQHVRVAHFMEAVGRLAPNVDIGGATSALATLTSRLGQDFPSSNRAWGVRVVPLLDELLGYYRPAIIVLIGAVGLLLVIACLNVASLLLTRAISREHEISVRAALGATPRHLFRQLLAESIILSGCGVVAGIIAATVALPLIVSATPVDIPRLDAVTINPRVLLFALGVATATTMVFGLVPSVVLRRRVVATGLRSSERGSSRASGRVYRVLVAGEVALASALLVGSALLVRTVVRMTSVPTGVSHANVLTATTQLTGAAYSDWDAVSAVYGSILDRIRNHPGVRAAGAATFLPLEAGWRVPFGIEGQVVARPEEQPQAQLHSVTPGYFDAIGATLIAGRDFTDRDRPDTPGAVIVNETFARQYLSDRPAVGRHLTTTSRQIGPLGANLVATGPLEVVGVIADVRGMPLGRPAEPAVYFTLRQYPFRPMALAVDASDRRTAVTAIQEALHAEAPNVPAADMRTWGERFSRRTAEPRLLMTLLVFFGGLAAVLAALGVYGLFSWSVALKKRELAIRITLGARPLGVGGAIFRQGLSLVAVGLLGGWILVRLSERALSGVLFNVSPGDPTSLAAAGSLLLLASLVACAPPAWRAMRLDPVEGLRTE